MHASTILAGRAIMFLEKANGKKKIFEGEKQKMNGKL